MSLPPGAREARAVGGGDINEAFCVRLAEGREAFVKTRKDAERGEYATEAAGLRWLAQADGLRVPAVLEVSESYLALEWIEPGQLDATGEEELGRGLAATHAAGAPGFGAWEGSSAAGWLGSLRVSNESTADWPSFYAERRLVPLARQARDAGALDGEGAKALERVCARLPELAGPSEPPARLHGDLWWGNVHADAEGRPWLIDPSAYGGHREVDLAMLALFGAIPARVLDSYQEATPLSEGWRERVGLYQLLALLVHALLFGGSYREAVVRMALRYG